MYVVEVESDPLRNVNLAIATVSKMEDRFDIEHVEPSSSVAASWGLGALSMGPSRDSFFVFFIIHRATTNGIRVLLET